MDKRKKEIIDFLSANLSCKECPLNGNECGDEGYVNCDALLSKYLCGETYPNISEVKEKTKEEETKQNDKEFEKMLSRFNALIGLEIMETPFGEITATMGDLRITGEPRDVAEFLRQAGDKFGA